MTHLSQECIGKLLIGWFDDFRHIRFISEKKYASLSFMKKLTLIKTFQPLFIVLHADLLYTADTTKMS